MRIGKLARAAWAAAGCFMAVTGAFAHADTIPGAGDRVLVLVNQARAEAGLQPLTMDPQLNDSAQRFSEYMASANFYAHDGPDGSTPLSRMNAAGFPGSGTWGENIAAYYSDADSVMQVWMASPGHRANILNPAFTHIGIGVAMNPSSQWKYYWTQDFGVRAGDSAPGAGASGTPVGSLPQGHQLILSSVSPTQGAAGDAVTLSGRSFGAAQGSVSFGGVGAAVLTWNDTQIQVQVPTGAADGAVYVQNAQGTSNGIKFTVTSSPSAPQPAATAPHAAYVYPPSGNAGSRVTVYGRGFGSSAGQVLFNGVPGQVAYWYDTLIGVDIPAGASTGPMFIRTNGGDSNPLQFTVDGGDPSATQPQLTYCSPAAGAAGSQVSVLGRNLGDTAGSVSFNGIAASVVNWTSSAVVVIVPQGATSGAVTVQTGGGTSNGVEFSVILQGQPSSPPLGSQPTDVTLPAPTLESPGTPPVGTGTPGGTGASQNQRWFGSNAQGSRAGWFNHPSSAPQPAPAPSGGAAPTDGGGTAVAAGQPTGIPAADEGGPVAETMAPAEAAPGATLTIQGRSFGSAQGWVRIGRIAAPVLSWTDTTVVAKVPSNVGFVGPVAVRVVRRDYKYTVALTLELSAGRQ